MLIWTIVSIGTNTALAFSPNYVLLCILRVVLGAGNSPFFCANTYYEIHLL